jgi:hypothetical protein
MFVVWALWGGSMVLISYVFDPTSPDPLTAFLETAWGFLPQFLAALAGTVVAVLIGMQMGNMTDPSAFGGIAALGAIPAGISLLTTLWGGYIWTHGISETQGITVKQGAICVLPAVALGLLAALLGVVSGLFGLAMMG